MPELPEVETIKRELQSEILNHKIISCKILRKDIIGYPEPEMFCKSILNQKIVDVSRRAKYLILELSNKMKIIFHLRLSGAIIYRDNFSGPSYDSGKLKEKFARLVIRLDSGFIIFYEPRALGKAYLLTENEKPPALKGFFKLSCEPISPEFDFHYLRNKLKGRKTSIKQLLLDQSICAGVGNIYSDEALFKAGIRPTRRANTLKADEIIKLLIALKDVLRKGIDEFGTTVSDYKRTNGKSGNFQKFLYVYAQEGKPCRLCGREIMVKKLGSRATRYCPNCQK
ncbi:MAG: bifunctional DNA-formamidopyrimidine glycosylase/DNA-(apurinic or apyrimidinic site) lyase [bacterium]